MATIEEGRPMEGAVSNPDVDTQSRDVAEPETLKRKASRDDHDEGSPKRAKQQDDDNTHIDRRRPRQDSPPSRRVSYGNASTFDNDRRKSATQEEKKRGKRLFGGLLSTLSQTAGNSQQKRRLDIERRQHERMQKQKVEDESKRAEKRARLTEIRMSEQMAFEKEVMEHKHTKMLAMAKFLRTKAHPHIYYLPWRLTPDQEGQIEDQVRDVKIVIDRDIETFKARKQWYGRDQGRLFQAARSPTPEKPPAFNTNNTSVDKPARGANGSEPPTNGPDKEQSSHHHHDESADVLEEADEDMVIY